MPSAAREKSLLILDRAHQVGWVALLSAVAALFFPVRLAVAAEAAAVDDAVAQATALNRQALASYEGGDFEEARKTINRALALFTSTALQQHPLHARTWLHLGIVLVGGFHQSKEGVAAFRKALKLQPTINLNSDLASPEIQAAFHEAQQAPLEPAPASVAEASSSVSALMHTPVIEGQRGSAISITVLVPRALAFDKLMLAYRKADGDEFLGRPMKPEASGAYTAEIPANATSGPVVSYFVEATDAAGDVVAARGSADAPLVIALVGDRPASGRRPDDGDEAGGDDAPARRVLCAFMLGSGVGLASGTGDLNADVMTPHAELAPARLLHLAPELGIWLSRSLLLSLQLRLQFVTGTTDLIVGDHHYHAAGRALAAFARASWLWRPWHALQPLFSLALGVGEIRHVVAFDYFDCGSDHHQRCIDTVSAGPFLAGAGTGLLYTLTERWALLTQLNVQLAAPRSTLNFDLNLGAAVRF
ncbi:MAG TPA: tetratricopeptide repeat protein [Polyangia bacterium]|jgi:tetratricopeptide (TPR) repeat protein|nr:tetratricopeptide repeat protein [Polyangia bacterium]